MSVTVAQVSIDFEMETALCDEMRSFFCFKVLNDSMEQ